MARFFISIFRFLKPRRGETLIILLSLFLLVVLMVPEFVKLTQNRWQLSDISLAFAFSPLLIFATSIGAGLGTFRRMDLLKNLWFVLTGIGLLLFCGFLFYRDNLMFRTNGQEQFATGFAVLDGWLLCVLCFTAAWGLTKAVTRLTSLLSQKYAAARVTRQRVMIGLAIMMFIVLTARNIVAETGVKMNLGVGDSPVFQALAGTVAVLFLAAIPAWAISQIRGWRSFFLSFAYLEVMACLSLLVVPLYISVLFALYGLIFSSVVVAMTSYLGTASDDKSRPYISIWGTTSIIVSLTVAFVTWNFDAYVFATWDSNDRIRFSREVKKLKIHPGVQANVEANWMQGGAWVYADIGFTKSVDPNCLAGLDNSPNQFSFFLTNVNPEIETSYIRNLTKNHGNVSDSHVTLQQIEDLGRSTTNFSVSNCQIEEPVGEGDAAYSLPGVGNYGMRELPPGATGRLLRYLDPKGFVGRINITHQVGLSDDDWIQVLECSREIPISYRGPVSTFAIEQAMKHDVHRFLVLNNLESDQPGYWNIVLDTQISVTGLLPTANGADVFWDTAFVSRGTEWSQRYVQNWDRFSRFNNFEFIDAAKRHHWIFSRNDRNQPTGLLVSFSAMNWLGEIALLADLETLSLDPRWLRSMKNYVDVRIPGSQDISLIGRLSKLKRLDLPLGLWGRDYSFLKNLPELEHLQFDVFANGKPQVNFGFSATNCPNLKTLVLFGRPPKSMAVEISKLPKIESVEIVDVDSTLIKPDQVKQFKSVLGNRVKLTIVPMEEDRVELPENFKAHIERVRKSIRAKYLGNKGILSVSD